MANDLTGVRARLLELAQESGSSLSSLSELIGRNTTYLQQFIRKGSPRKLEEQDRRTLAQFLGVDEIELGAEVEVKSYASPIKAQEKLSVAPRDWVEVPRLDLGASAGPGAMADSGEQAFDAFQFSANWLREQGLSNAKLSAISVQGDSMEPLLRDGDEILVDCAAATFRDGV
ncbi:MAG: S24 family peptidase, partial [Marinomonas sp.]